MPKSYTRGRRKRKYRKRASQPYGKRGRKKGSSKKVARRKKGNSKRTAKRKASTLTPSFQKKLKKVARRVLTSMNDEKATMYRQYVPPESTVVIDGTAITLDHTTPIVDGGFVYNNNNEMREVLRRETGGFFQIPEYRGMIAPSYQFGSCGPGDNNLNEDVGNHALLNNDSHRVDIRAFKELELPFLPCVPRFNGLMSTNPANANAYFKTKTDLDEFCRSGQKIKITNNYMRFKFFATKNGEITRLAQHTSEDVPNTTQEGGHINTGLPSTLPGNNVDTGLPFSRLVMLGANSNIKVTRAFGGEAHERIDINETVNNTLNLAGSAVTSGVTTGAHLITRYRNHPLSYEITARRYAKVRIIVVERECYDSDPIELSDFMKYSEDTDWSQEFHYGSEELHQQKRFNSKVKTKRDLPYFQDTPELKQKAKVKFIVDKTINLPMGREKVVILNPLKGKVLEYDPVNPIAAVTDLGTLGNLDNEAGDFNEIGGGSGNEALPTNSNDFNVLSSIQKKNEYVPINKQYAMFMLMSCQRAGIEYDVFQKFEYDK